MKINIKKIAEGSYIAPSCETIAIRLEQLICKSVTRNSSLEELKEPNSPFPW